MVKDAIDEGLPCYGWELDIPEYYVVYGYDEKGYLFKGPMCEKGKGSKPWSELGDSEIGVLEMYVVSPGSPQDEKIIEFALRIGIMVLRKREE